MIVFGADAAWTQALHDLGVRDIVAVAQPAVGDADDEVGDDVIRHDLRDPYVADRPFDLALCIGLADQLPASAAETLVASLCTVAPVVAFAAAMPGSAPPATPNPRWPAWWDSLFAARRRVAHDVIRPRLWSDDRVDLLLRQCLLLYAAEGRFVPEPWPESAARSVVHPAAHHLALAAADARRRAEANLLDVQLLEAEREAAELRSTIEILEEKVAGSGDDRPPDTEADDSELARRLTEMELERDDLYDDVVLLWAGLIANERTSIVQAHRLSRFEELRSNPRRAAVRR